MVGEQGWTSRVFCIAQMSRPADLQGNPQGRTACGIESPTSSAGCSATITDYLTCLSSYFERVLCIGFEAASACNEAPISAKSMPTRSWISIMEGLQYRRPVRYRLLLLHRTRVDLSLETEFGEGK